MRSDWPDAKRAILRVLGALFSGALWLASKLDRLADGLAALQRLAFVYIRSVLAIIGALFVLHHIALTIDPFFFAAEEFPIDEGGATDLGFIRPKLRPQ